jgi:hypothetical protein
MEGGTVTTIESRSQVLGQPEAPFTLDEDQLAAVAFLARYSGRTLEVYRHAEPSASSQALGAAS